MSESTYTPVERAAIAAFVEEFWHQPTEPLRTKGGALDPKGWTMRLAEALERGGQLPLLWRDQRTPADYPAVLAARAVLEAGQRGAQDDLEPSPSCGGER